MVGCVPGQEFSVSYSILLGTQLVKLGIIEAHYSGGKHVKNHPKSKLGKIF